MLKNINQIPVSIIFRNLTGICLKHQIFGEPANVLEICEEEIDEPKNYEVIVKILAAPINPSDVNTIQGKYPIKLQLPAIGGHECVGDVISIGPLVNKLKPGNRVIVAENGLGTWRTIAKYQEKSLMKISDKISIPEAATMKVNPSTAFRMLKDFVKLKPGDTIIQNGANSAVGQAVHQICKVWDIQSVGIIRDREGVCDLKTYLRSLGATEILTDDKVRTTDIFRNQLPQPKLALNCVGGRNASTMAFHLQTHGTMVTYGGMSRKPVAIPASLIIFRDISFKGFWLHRWSKINYSNKEKQMMFDELSELIIWGALKAPMHKMIPLENYKEGLTATLNFSGYTGHKYIFDMNNEDIQIK